MYLQLQSESEDPLKDKYFIFTKTSSGIPELVANSLSVWNDNNFLSEIVIYEDVYNVFCIVDDMLQNVSRSDLN